jgi:hypothetical protein
MIRARINGNELCICGHKLYDHYSKKYNEECIHRTGRYTEGIKCDCGGYATDNLDYVENIAKKRQLI